jgi:hypothetical protein
MEQIEINHPDWCDRALCRENKDGSIIHGRLLGTVEGDEVKVDVGVERVDEPDGTGKVKAGSARAYSHVRAAGRLSGKEVMRLNRLHHSAESFAGRRVVGGLS